MLNIYLFLTLLLFGCSDVFDDETVYGCDDERACNYSTNVTAYWSGSCEYPEDIYGGEEGDFNCSGECIVEQDCNGVCGGDIIDSDNDNICDDIDVCIGEYSDINGLYCSDLHVLNDFKNMNIGSDLDSMDISEILNSNCLINGYGRIEYLSLSNKNIFSVPSSIEYLDSLEVLYLNDNNIVSLPVSICNLNDLCEIFVQNNKLCSEYQYDCIDHWGEQDCGE